MTATTPNPDASDAVPARTTIAVISFNYGRFLAEAVESALAQDVEDVRVVVIDDGSTDDTPAVAASFGERISYYRKENGGLSDARNYAAQRCDTEFLVYLDADDALARNFVRECRRRLEAEPRAAFAFTQLRYFGDREGVSSFPPFDLERLKRGTCAPSCSLLRTAVARRYGYDTRLDGFEDWDFYLCLAEDGHFGVLVDATFVARRFHSSNMGKTVLGVGPRRRRLYLRILRKHRRFFGVGGVARMIGRSLRHRTRRMLAAGRRSGLEPR